MLRVIYRFLKAVKYHFELLCKINTWPRSNKRCYGAIAKPAEFFRCIKTLAIFWILRPYLTVVSEVDIRWHLLNMNLTKRTQHTLCKIGNTHNREISERSFRNPIPDILQPWPWLWIYAAIKSTMNGTVYWVGDAWRANRMGSPWLTLEVPRDLSRSRPLFWITSSGDENVTRIHDIPGN